MVAAYLASPARGKPGAWQFVHRTDRTDFIMKWYFSINQAGSAGAAGWHARLAVLTAKQVTGLVPYLLYYGERNRFTEWMEAQGVTVIDTVPSYVDAILKAVHQRRYSQQFIGHWLRTEICQIEAEDEFVLYTDVDVVFLKPFQRPDSLPAFFACAPEFDKNNWSYFNSGVMWLNVPALKADYPAFQAHIRQRLAQPEYCDFRDQRMYNEFYRGRWSRLDPINNWKPYWKVSDAASILHFHGPKIPDLRRILDGRWNWNSTFGQQIGNLFLKHVRSYEAWLTRILGILGPGSAALDFLIESVAADARPRAPALRKLSAAAAAHADEPGTPPPATRAEQPAASPAQPPRQRKARPFSRSRRYEFHYQGRTVTETAYGANFIDELIRIMNDIVPSSVRNIVEWGSGLSSLVITDCAHKKWKPDLFLTIDDNAAYQRAIFAGQKMPAWLSYKALNQVGPTRSQADPELAYSTYPLLFNRKFDLILIDGRRRLECAFVAAMLCHPSSIVVLHDYRRTRYQPVRALYEILEDGPQFRVLKIRQNLAMEFAAGGEATAQIIERLALRGE